MYLPTRNVSFCKKLVVNPTPEISRSNIFEVKVSSNPFGSLYDPSAALIPAAIP